MPVVLLNPYAQGGRARLWRAPLTQWLAHHAPDVQLVVAEHIEDALSLIDSLPQGSRVVAVGGDGTLNRWLPAILRGRHELGLLPLGSGNDVARALGIYGLPWQDALRHALCAPVQWVDVGCAHYEGHTTPFLSSFTAGFDSAVCKRALEGPTWLRGLPRYVWAILHEVINVKNWNVRIAINDEAPIEDTCLLVCTLNTPTLGSGMPAIGRAKMDDGALDVLQAGRFGFWSTLGILPRLLLGMHLSHPRIHLYRMQHMTITSEQPLPLASDGEYRGLTHQLAIELQAARLAVVKYEAL